MKQLKRNKWYLILSLLLLFSCSKDNEPANLNQLSQENFVGLSQAKEIAKDISFKKQSESQTSKSSTFGIEKKTMQSINEVKNKEGKTVFYVINYVGGGYLILSSDNRMQPIIAFSNDGKFVLDENAYSEGLKSWMNNAEIQITAIQNSNIKQTEKEKLAWRQVKNTLANQNLFAKIPADKCIERTVVEVKGPYLNSKWWQKGGYNEALPYINCDGVKYHVLAGCVPIAMAQVMRYYQYPMNYNWSLMSLDNTTLTTANFISDIHNAISNVYPSTLSYSCSATGVSKNSDMGEVLKRQFGYSVADWSDYNYQVVKNNLAAGKPVILQGFSDYGGHMWVCDGYQSSSYYFDDCTGISTLYFHMNWGWDPSKNNDGFYAYNNFNPDVYNFNSGLKMTYNIKP